jgi:hypothetical protein
MSMAFSPPRMIRVGIVDNVFIVVVAAVVVRR